MSHSTVLASQVAWITGESQFSRLIELNWKPELNGRIRLRSILDSQPWSMKVITGTYVSQLLFLIVSSDNCDVFATFVLNLKRQPHSWRFRRGRLCSEKCHFWVRRREGWRTRWPCWALRPPLVGRRTRSCRSSYEHPTGPRQASWVIRD